MRLRLQLGQVTHFFDVMLDYNTCLLNIHIYFKRFFHFLSTRSELHKMCTLRSQRKLDLGAGLVCWCSSSLQSSVLISMRRFSSQMQTVPTLLNHTLILTAALEHHPYGPFRYFLNSNKTHQMTFLTQFTPGYGSNHKVCPVAHPRTRIEITLQLTQ